MMMIMMMMMMMMMMIHFGIMFCWVGVSLSSAQQISWSQIQRRFTAPGFWLEMTHHWSTSGWMLLVSDSSAVMQPRSSETQSIALIDQ